ncbi:MAG: phosphatase PAP2 family protein [Acidobacteria bacterium]|nr:phosphatase PAP2 family protein [Acidobacteriota bacterium]
MPARLLPFLLALGVSALVLTAVALEPYFAGDVSVARAVQAVSPGTGWATAVTSLATAPNKYVVMVLAVVLSWLLAGWKGAAIAIAAIAIEQTFGEASKNIAQRPRPSRDLIAVVGSPSGFSFPSTFTTFVAVTFGTVMLLARRSRARTAPFVMIVAALVIVVGWAARVALGAHWPSDVVLTSVVCLAWVWAAIRALRP